MRRADKILIVEDSESVRDSIIEYLQSCGYDTEAAGSVREADDAFRRDRHDALVCDYKLPDGTALDVLARLRLTDPNPNMIVLTAHPSIDLAVQAMREGAKHFLTKPVALPALEVILSRLLSEQRIRRNELARDRSRVTQFDPFLGDSSSIRVVRDLAARVAGSDASVLLIGETGSGKGVLARWIHEHSPRAEEAFVNLNCAGLARDFLESELFGHEKGAFTGAHAAKMGLLEVANKGTLFLDEIGDVDVQVQPKLLKVLEEKSFRRMGDVRDRRVNIRLLAATHQDLEALVATNRFRRDLLFRINTIVIRIPSLRERAEDVPVLAERILATLLAEAGRGEVRLSRTAIGAMQRHSWPGNIRELRNVLERATLIASTDEIGPQDLALVPTAGDAGGSALTFTLSEVEKQHIERVLAAEDGNIERTARILGISRSTLYQKLKSFRDEG